MAELIKVDIGGDGARLDSWLQKRFENLPFGELQKMLRTGQIRIDGKRAKGNQRLSEGQEIRLPPQINDVKPNENKERRLSEKEENFIQALVLYRDEHIIAINKPAGIATQGGTRVTKHIFGLLDGLKFGNEEKPHLVHRLDKETSGVLLLARNAKAARELGYMFRDRDIRKYYWALTNGVPDPIQGTVTTFIEDNSSDEDDREDSGRGRRGSKEKKPKKAFTIYSVLENAGKSLAWVAFWPRTGRKHQIRLHALEMNTPLVGDYRYSREQPILETSPDIPDMLYLHARRIIFRHPITGKKLDITAPLGDEMKKAWKYFNFNADEKSDPFEGFDL